MTAMESLEQMGAVAPGIPRFDGGMANLRELIRLMAEALVNEIMDAQADEACAEGNQRNGYRERTLVTSVGPITLRIPKLRVGSYFPEDLLVRYSRVDRAVIAAVSEMVTNGVGARKVEKAAHAMGIGRMSAGQVSRICESLDAVVEDLQTRVFGELRFPYLWLDATYLKCRDAGHASSTALVTAIACGDDGYRRLVGLDAVDAESYLGWRGFLQSLRSRGVDGVVCVTSDAREGLRKAIEEVFPGAAWQRCIVHLERNATSCAKSQRHKAAIGSILHAVFAEKDPALVREPYHLACEKIAGFNAKAAELLEEAEADALAYLDFPHGHRRRLRANNVQERVNREVKRRSRVVQVFPSRKSLIRMLGAVLSEKDEDRSTRRRFAATSISEAYEEPERRKPAPKPTYKGTAAEHAARIIALVLSGNVDSIGKAA